jgi:hypothetical protein
MRERGAAVAVCGIHKQAEGCTAWCLLISVYCTTDVAEYCLCHMSPCAAVELLDVFDIYAALASADNLFTSLPLQR